jgi:hypothetical protein
MRTTFLQFVTNETDLNRILTNNTSQNFANMTQYLQDAVSYCKANGIKALYFPSGTYRFNGTTLDGLHNFHLIGEGAVIRQNALAGTNFLWGFINSRHVRISGFYFLGSNGSYADYDFLNIGSGCAWFKIHNNTFQLMRRSAIFIHSLNGGTTSEGCDIFANEFRGHGNYNNNQQASVILGLNGEYCKVYNNYFKAVPSALRAINGANGSFMNNTIQSVGSQGFDPDYNRGIIYLDDTGTNNGKFDILYNKINHNGSGISAIVYKGVKTKPRNAGRIVGNDILVHGSSTSANAIYLKNAPKTVLRDNKIRGHSNHSSGIIIDNSDACYLEGNFIAAYENGIEIINSNNTEFGYNDFDGVTNNILN